MQFSQFFAEWKWEFRSEWGAAKELIISDHARRGKRMKCARKLLWFLAGWSLFGASKRKRSLERSGTMCTGFGLLELDKCRQVHVQHAQLVLTANGDKKTEKLIFRSVAIGRGRKGGRLQMLKIGYFFSFTIRKVHRWEKFQGIGI